MKTKKFIQSRATLVRFVVLLFVCSLLIGWLYNIGVNRPPLVYADIPDRTIDFLNKVGKKSRDIGMKYNEKGPNKWENDDDIGNDLTWKKEEGMNFVVYYHPDSEAKWQGLAQTLLQEAEATIPKLEDMMGCYYYPEDMNGRKLPIYMPSTENSYSNTINELLETSSFQATGTLGICISEVGPYGYKAKGIVMNPACFDPFADEMNGWVKVLQHEMNHYVFFASLNYGKSIEHFLWVSEGIAEYFCARNGGAQISDEEKIDFIQQNCMLDGEFPSETASAYWAGESFYLYLQQKGGRQMVQKWLQNAYQYSTDSTLIMSNLEPVATQQDWVNSLCGAPTSTSENP